jgi:hypothetical protein
MVIGMNPDEVELTGHWTFDGTRMLADEVCARIERLTSQVLQKIAVSKDYGAWETLFRDPEDGRLWERTYPHGDLQGGGPPRLAVISLEEARRKYGDVA